MSCIRFILPLLAAVSISITAPFAWADEAQERCAAMRLNQPVASAVGYSLKRMKMDQIDIGDSIVVTEPRMAGLRGPNISLLGRDVRLAVTRWQASPQELWHKGQWNASRDNHLCDFQDVGWMTSLKRGFYINTALEHEMGLNNGDPKIIYRTRAIADFMLVRPYGLTLGASLALPIITNTHALDALPDARPRVRRDMADFTNSDGLERLYTSWHATPINDLHLGVSAGYLEEMYAGVGGEVVWRPWSKPFWLGADAWSVWRRDPHSYLNMDLSDDMDFTGHLRAGYDIPNTRSTLYASAGKYLAGDIGATLGLNHNLGSGARINAQITWTDRKELIGFVKDTKFDPMLRITWPLGKPKLRSKHELRTALRQMGRDGGQMLDRPMPIENMTESFSTREVARHWPVMFEKEEPDYLAAKKRTAN